MKTEGNVKELKRWNITKSKWIKRIKNKNFTKLQIKVIKEEKQVLEQNYKIEKSSKKWI